MVIKTFLGGNPSLGSVRGRSHQSRLLGNTPSTFLTAVDSCLWLVPSVQIYLLDIFCHLLEIFKHKMLVNAGHFQHLLYPVLPCSGYQSRDVALKEGDVFWEDKSPGRCQEQIQACAWGLLKGQKLT